jgi:hypothetical protein
VQPCGFEEHSSLTGLAIVSCFDDLVMFEQFGMRSRETSRREHDGANPGPTDSHQLSAEILLASTDHSRYAPREVDGDSIPDRHQMTSR